MITVIFVLPLLIVCVGATALYYSWAISLLWSWFIAPLGLPELSLAHAYGLGLLVNLFQTVQQKVKGEEYDVENALTTLLIKPIVVVVLGWIVKTQFLSGL